MWNRKRVERGQGLVEYALILVLIAVVVLVVLQLLGGRVNMVFARILLQIDHPGDYSGDPVTASVDSIDVIEGPGGRTFTPNIELDPPDNSATICVQFSDSQHGSQLKCGANPNATFPSDGEGSVQACVIGVQGHSLRGAACTSTSY